jgi:hypothetical protein
MQKSSIATSHGILERFPGVRLSESIDLPSISPDLPPHFRLVPPKGSSSILNMRLILFFNAAFIALLRPIAAAPQCFYPDGVTVEPNHTPCNTTVTDSSCCLPQDSCTADGLCLGTSNFNYRGSCTDKTWTSNACPQTCRLGKV